MPRALDLSNLVERFLPVYKMGFKQKPDSATQAGSHFLSKIVDWAISSHIADTIEWVCLFDIFCAWRKK